MDIFLTVVGTAVIAVGLFDMFHTLLHPSGKGYLSSLMLSGLRRVSRAAAADLDADLVHPALPAVVASPDVGAAAQFWRPP